ncbi:MAG: lipopolysaccharide biosynthesis protein [Woeseiaceae bacterium]
MASSQLSLPTAATVTDLNWLLVAQRADTVARISHAWLGTLATNVAILACTLATGVLLARLLEPEGRGALAAVMFWPQLIVGIGLLSLNDGIIFHAHVTQSDKRVFTTTALCLGLVLSALTVVLGLILLPHLLGPQHSHLAWMAQVYLVGMAPLTFIDVVSLALDQSDLRFRRSNLVRLILSHTYLLGLVLLLAFGAVSIATALWVYWLGLLLTAAARIALIRRELATTLCAQDAKAILTASQRFHRGFLVFLLGSQADRIVVVTFWDASSIGHYVIAASIATAGLMSLTYSFQAVLVPRIAAAAGNAERKVWLVRGLRFSNVLIGLSALGLAAVVSWLVPLMYGDSFAPAVVPAVILALGGWPLALRQIIMRCLRAFGESGIAVIAESIALLGFLALVWPLSGLLGLSGIALSMAAANLIALIYLAAALQWRFGLSFMQWHGFDAVALAGLLQAFTSALKLRKEQDARARPTP